MLTAQRLLAAVVLICTAVSVRAEEAGSSVPFDAYVAAKIALARSGPGRDQYPTDPLARGDKVEVLEVREEWLAIRAPSDSFSWVPSDQLRRLADGTQAEVIGEDVYCWVGSNISEIKQHIHQVRLRRGEIVTILGEKEVTSAAGLPSSWVKIRPPTGERRWLHRDEIARTPPTTAAVAAKEDAVPKAEDSLPADSEAEVPLDAPRAKSKKRPAPAAEEQDELSGWTDRKGGRPVRRRAAAEGRAARQATASSAPASKLPEDVASLLLLPSDASFADALTRLQVAFSRVAAQGASPDQWTLLEQHTMALVRRGQTPYERGQATLLLDSIREFRLLADRRGTLGEPGAELASTPMATAASATLTTSSPESAVEVEAAPGTPYLAEGWLMPVASPKNSAPPFVIMDKDGHPVAFVTPAPGVNLRRYIDKEVGLLGQKSFQVYDQLHVIAHRAVELDRHREPALRVGSAAPWIRYRSATREE